MHVERVKEHPHGDAGKHQAEQPEEGGMKRVKQVCERKTDVRKMLDVIDSAERLADSRLVETKHQAKQNQCQSPAHCALGELLFQAGMSNSELHHSPSTPDGFTERQLRLLYDTYGLTKSMAETVMEANDRVEDVDVMDIDAENEVKAEELYRKAQAKVNERRKRVVRSTIARFKPIVRKYEGGMY